MARHSDGVERRQRSQLAATHRHSLRSAISSRFFGITRNWSKTAAAAVALLAHQGEGSGGGEQEEEEEGSSGVTSPHSGMPIYRVQAGDTRLMIDDHRN